MDPAAQPSSRAPGSLGAALVLGAACLAVGALGWGWELLARQAPSSAWHVAGFPAAIERLALQGWLEGLAVFALAPRAWQAELARRPRVARVVVAAAWGGTLMAFGALAYAARSGVMGVQVRDASAAGHGVFVARAGGHAVLLAVLARVVRAALRPVATD